MALADYAVQVNDPGKSRSASDDIEIQWEWLPGIKEPDNLKYGQFKLCTVSSGKLNCGQDGQYLGANITISGKQSYTANLGKMKDIAKNGLFTVQFSANNEDYSEQTIFYAQQFFTISSGMTGSKEANEGSIPSGSMKGIGASSVSWSTYTLPQSLSSLQWSAGVPQEAYTVGYLMPYTWQKGPTRTAPFQSTPSTKVTAVYTGGRNSKRFPTSSYTPFKSLSVYKYMQLSTVTPSPMSTQFVTLNWASTIATTPSGYKPSRVIPSIAPQTSATASGSGGGNSRRRRRWVD